MNIKFARVHPAAKIPEQKTKGAAAFDIATCGEGVVPPGCAIIFPTGIKAEIPDGFGMFVYSRSGHGFHDSIRLSNCVGVIDSDYRGEIKVRLHNDGTKPFYVVKGDRIAQGVIMPLPQVTFVEVDEEELSKTVRGEDGFGSTNGVAKVIQQQIEFQDPNHGG